jgi:hypothetical protein
LRGAGHPIPDEDGQLALLGHPALAGLRDALGVGDPPVAPAKASSPRLSITNLRNFLEYPIQAWAQVVLGLDELPDDDPSEASDEPFHLARKHRAGLLREVFAMHLGGGESLEDCYDAAVAELQLRGQFPVGVFAEAARVRDLGVLEIWRAGLGRIEIATARFGFGRAWSPGAELRPALDLALDEVGRSVRIVGQTELLLAGPDGRYVSVVPMLRELERRTPYHLRGAIDHVVLAAAGIATGGHTHRLLDPEGRISEVHHAAWSQRDARDYLAGLARELVDRAHGYLLPFDTLAKALGGKPSPRTYGDPTFGLGYGPVERRDGLVRPTDAIAIAQRRLRPLVERMHGDHGFEIARPGPPSTRPPFQAPTPAPSSPTTTRDGRPALQIIKGGKP